MPRIQGDITIHRPVAEVFDFVSDERHEPQYNPQMLSVEMITPEPIGLGSQFRAQMQSAQGSVPVLLEFTAFNRPTRLASRSSFAGLVIDGELAFTAVGASTRMAWVWDIKPTGARKLFTPLIGWIGRRQENRVWSELKRVLEQNAPGGDGDLASGDSGAR